MDDNRGESRKESRTQKRTGGKTSVVTEREKNAAKKRNACIQRKEIDRIVKSISVYCDKKHARDFSPGKAARLLNELLDKTDYIELNIDSFINIFKKYSDKVLEAQYIEFCDIYKEELNEKLEELRDELEEEYDEEEYDEDDEEEEYDGDDYEEEYDDFIEVEKDEDVSSRYQEKTPNRRTVRVEDIGAIVREVKNEKYKSERSYTVGNRMRRERFTYEIYETERADELIPNKLEDSTQYTNYRGNDNKLYIEQKADFDEEDERYEDEEDERYEEEKYKRKRASNKRFNKSKQVIQKKMRDMAKRRWAEKQRSDFMKLGNSIIRTCSSYEMSTIEKAERDLDNLFEYTEYIRYKTVEFKTNYMACVKEIGKAKKRIEEEKYKEIRYDLRKKYNRRRKLNGMF